MDFLILEGPAGSGKSTLASRIMEKLPEHHQIVKLPDPFELPRPRSYNGKAGINLSLQKDILHLSQGIIQWREEKLTQVIDRFLISQWVYGSLRSDMYNLFSDVGFSLVQSGMMMARSIFVNLEFREIERFAVPIEVVPPITFTFLILLPKAEFLKRVREDLSREFPYEPEIECHLYTQAADLLRKISKTQDQPGRPYEDRIIVRTAEYDHFRQLDQWPKGIIFRPLHE